MQEPCALLGQVFRLLGTGEAMTAKGWGGWEGEKYLNIKQIEALIATATEVDKKHQLRAFGRRADVVALRSRRAVGTRPPAGVAVACCFSRQNILSSPSLGVRATSSQAS